MTKCYNETYGKGMDPTFFLLQIYNLPKLYT